jgi:hypothetical protein
MIAEPYPKETQLAQKRFQNFLRRANANERLTLAKTPFVAVRAYQLTADEVPGLVWRISLGRVPMKGYYGDDLIYNTGSIPVEFLLMAFWSSDPLSEDRSDNSAECRPFTQTVVGGNCGECLQHLNRDRIQLVS